MKHRVAAFLAAFLLAAGCFVGSSGEGTDDGSDPGGGAQPSPGATRADGTMTAEEFQQDIQDAVGLAEQYWGERVRGFQPVEDVFAYERDGEVDCGGEPVPRNNAVYCPAGDFIAYDVNFAVAAFRQVGDAFLFYLLGHEYAHAVQQRLGVRSRFTIDHELQADCMAGAYIGDSVRDQRLTLDEGDLEEFQSGLLAVGDDPSIPWFTPGAHGTAEQRTQAFFEGYERSMDACGL